MPASLSYSQARHPSTTFMGLSWLSCGLDSELSLQRVRIQSLIRELRSHKLVAWLKKNKTKQCSVGRQAVQSWCGSAMMSSIVQISCLIDLPSLMSGFSLKVILIFQVVILDPVSTWNFRQEKGNSRKGNKAGSC